VRLAFDLFARLGSRLRVVKYFREHGLLFPVRREGGREEGALVWGPLRHGRLLQLLHLPVYAGAYVFGRTSRERHPGSPRAPAFPVTQAGRRQRLLFRGLLRIDSRYGP
jgi:Recombinase